MSQTRIDDLRARLLPRGTQLKDADPDWRGLSWREYLELCILESRIAKPKEPEKKPAEAEKKLKFGKKQQKGAA